MLTLCLALLATGETPQVAAVDGTMHRPLAERHHHPALLVFISHDCPICNAYAPELQRLAYTFGKSQVTMSLVYAEPKLSAISARKHASAYSLGGYHLYLDPHGSLSKFAGATITPEAALYDANGKLAYLGRIDDRYVAFGKQRPQITKHDLGDALDAVLSGRKVVNTRTTSVGCYIATESK